MAKTVTKKTVSKKVTYKPSYVAVNKPGAAPVYKNTEKAPTYKTTAKAPEAFKIGTYNSQYQPQIESALNTITNWNYDPTQDASYQALAKVYGARGNQAAKNSMADAAALNGGYGTSFAVSAAQQARNQYNQELASYLPDLEQTAFNRAQTTYNALMDADNTAYGRFRDTEEDRKWVWDNAYQAYRDKVGDDQWLFSQKYNAYRDRVGDKQWEYTQKYDKYKDILSQYQWALDYNNGIYSMKHSGGGGGGGRSGGGGGGYAGGGSTADIGDPYGDAARPIFGTGGRTLGRSLGNNDEEKPAKNYESKKSGNKASTKKNATVTKPKTKTAKKAALKKARAGFAKQQAKKKNKFSLNKFGNNKF